MGKCPSVREVSRRQRTMCLLRSRAWQKALGSCCVSIRGKWLAFTGRSAGERQGEGRTEEWRVSSSVMIQWGDSGISCSCYTMHTHPSMRVQNSPLALHHSNYGNIKARWHLIFCHFLRLNMTNSGIAFPLGPQADFDVSLTPRRPSTCQLLIFPSHALLRQGPGFLRDHFVWHSAFHFPLTSSSRPPFVSLLTYIEVLPHLVGSSLSRPSWSPSTPPPRLPHTCLIQSRSWTIRPSFSHQCRQDNTAPRLCPHTEKPAEPAASEQTRRQ